MKRLRASECSSPWLMTPRAAPSTPSTVTSRSTRRARAVSGELDPPELDVALLPEVLPDPGRLLGDRGEAVVADPGRGLLEPRLRRLEALEVGGARGRLARARQPGRDLDGHADATRPPGGRARPARRRAGGRPRPAAARSPTRRGRRASPRSVIDPALTQTPRASTSSPRSSPTSAARVQDVGLQDGQALPLAPRGLGPFVDGVRLARLLAQAAPRPPAAACSRRGRGRPSGRRPGSRRRRGRRGSGARARGARPRRETWRRRFPGRLDRSGGRRASRRRRPRRAPRSGGSRVAMPRSTSASAAPAPGSPAPAEDLVDRAKVPVLALDAPPRPAAPAVVARRAAARAGGPVLRSRP